MIQHFTAVKAARSNQKITRDTLAEIVGVYDRHLAEIENRAIVQGETLSIAPT